MSRLLLTSHITCFTSDSARYVSDHDSVGYESAEARCVSMGGDLVDFWNEDSKGYVIGQTTSSFVCRIPNDNIRKENRIGSFGYKLPKSAALTHRGKADTG